MFSLFVYFLSNIEMLHRNLLGQTCDLRLLIMNHRDLPLPSGRQYLSSHDYMKAHREIVRTVMSYIVVTEFC